MPALTMLIMFVGPAMKSGVPRPQGRACKPCGTGSWTIGVSYLS